VISCEQQVISTDGAYVPLVKGEWAEEVRTVAIGEAKAKVTATSESARYTPATCLTFHA
jgi:hypothetical protein